MNFLPEDLELPDMSPLPSEGGNQETLIEHRLTVSQIQCILRIACTRERLFPVSQRSSDRASLQIVLWDASANTPFARINSVLIETRQPLSRYWSIHGRSVLPPYRRRGFAEFCFRVTEDLMSRFTVYPNMRAVRREVRTQLTSVSRLVVDQDWLDVQGFGHLRKRHGINLGYHPRIEDEKNAIRLLQDCLEDASEILPSTPAAIFVKHT